MLSKSARNLKGILSAILLDSWLSADNENMGYLIRIIKTLVNEQRLECGTVFQSSKVNEKCLAGAMMW